jgi:GT2 family glycosyltransferase
MIDVDVIIPVFNSLHVVRPCVESVLRNSSGPYRTLLIDDGSDSQTRGVLETYAAGHDRVEVLANPRNLGFVHAANRGLAASSARLVVLLNSDTVVPPRWLERVRACFGSDQLIGIASPISNFAPHNRIPMLPGTDHVAMDELIAALSDRRYPDVTTPEGFCYVIRRETLEQVGSLDLVFDRGYGEESDLAMRANYHGWRTVCIDDLYIYHRGRGTFGQDVRDELYAANKGIFYDRWANRYRDDYEEFVRRAPLDPLRARLAALVPPGVESAYKDR